MSFAQELAFDIFESEAFHDDISRLIEASVLFDFATLSLKTNGESQELDFSIVSRLLQSAAIFADTEHEVFRDLAQRICTATLKLYGENDSVRALFSLTQARLKNFPALFPEMGNNVPENLPVPLQYEFIQSRLQQTVELTDGVRLTFTPFQFDSWEKLTNKYSVTITGPTSSGKSFVLLLYLIEKLKLNEEMACAYIVPTRALINQVSDDASKELERQRIRDVLITTAPIDIREAGKQRILYVLTQERLEALLTTNDDINIDIIIIDEAQIISDGSRGVLLESVLDRIIKTSPSTQFIFSGPLIGNPDFFSKLVQTEKFTSCSTQQSPVTQNIIYLNCSNIPKSEVKISIGIGDSVRELATVELPHRLLTDSDKLSYLSALLGSSGSSVVYAAGKADAEKISQLIAQNLPEHPIVKEDLSELIRFVKRHVHKDYALVGTLEKGIGFHYGHMPSLLRKNLEDHFKERRLSYLVCTSTLLYGLNMPAKNIFMLKPKTGRETPIPGPAFWNLAGRAGRLGKELEGNVFVIDYDQWESKPITEGKNVFVDSALRSTMIDNSEEFVDFLTSTDVPSDSNLDFEIALGKLVLDCKSGRLDDTIAKYESISSREKLKKISEIIKQVSDESPLPFNVINKNIGVSIFRQTDLLNYIMERIDSAGPEALIPAFPLDDFRTAHTSYLRAFKRIHNHLLKYKKEDKSHLFFAGLALKWMRGDSLPQLINSSIKYYKKHNPSKSTASIIRETMENIENDLRFRYVKYFTCYNSLLAHSLVSKSFHEYVDVIPDVPLYLEMGGSSGSMINMMALGLSRTTAESLIEFMTDKEMDIHDIKSWLRNQKIEQFDIATACINEIKELLSK